MFSYDFLNFNTFLFGSLENGTILHPDNKNKNNNKMRNELKTNELTKSHLISLIIQASTSDDLRAILEAIPLQENGCERRIRRICENAFWYIDLDTVEKQKEFMVERVEFYGVS